MKNINSKLRITFGDVTCGVHGVDFNYLFSYATNGLESLVIDNKEWIYRSAKPTFWRATTDNDKGNGFCLKSGVWSAADQFIGCINMVIEVDDKIIYDFLPPNNNFFMSDVEAVTFKITFVYETITVPKTNVIISYSINSSGDMHVNVKYIGKKKLPSLPVFGIRLVMPTLAKKYVYKGLSGETYPDRKQGAIAGEYEIEGLPVTPYLSPQECGMHMDTSWVEIYRDTVLDNRDLDKKMSCLRIEALENKFAFSCLPYTALELENATHQEELPPKRRTVLNILGAVRGVGGIDSWGADVEERYTIDATKDMEFEFVIRNL